MPSTLHPKRSDETTPLLTPIDPVPISENDAANNGTANANVVEDADLGKPLPIRQILLLCFTSAVAPVAFFSIFPYVNFMIERVGGVGKDEVGFWSGLIESLFSAVQMCVMIFWGRVSLLQDKFAKPAADRFQGLGSVWKEACPCAVSPWHGCRYGVVRIEPNALADDSLQMPGWVLCWYGCYGSGYVE